MKGPSPDWLWLSEWRMLSPVGSLKAVARLHPIIAAFCWANWVRTSDPQRATKVPPCRNLAGNRCEELLEYCCLISILTTFGWVSLIYYRFDNMLELIFHRSINAGFTSLASHRPESPHYFCVSLTYKTYRIYILDQHSALFSTNSNGDLCCMLQIIKFSVFVKVHEQD